MKSVLIFIVYLTLFYFCSGNEDEFQKKYCDPSLSDAKVSELEKCEQAFPKELIEADNKCLTEIKMGTTYKDIRKTHCDLNLFKQYMECLKKRDDFANLEKKFQEVSEKYYTCVYKVLDIQSGTVQNSS